MLLQETRLIAARTAIASSVIPEPIVIAKEKECSIAVEETILNIILSVLDKEGGLHYEQLSYQGPESD